MVPSGSQHWANGHHCHFAATASTSLAAAVAAKFVPMEQTPTDTGLHCIISVDRHGSLNKLLSITAYVYHFIDNLRARLLQRLGGPMTAEEF